MTCLYTSNNDKIQRRPVYNFCTFFYIWMEVLSKYTFEIYFQLHNSFFLHGKSLECIKRELWLGGSFFGCHTVILVKIHIVDEDTPNKLKSIE